MPDMTMIERVARAICNQFTGSDTWADDIVGGVVSWTTYIPEARAAIEAMREPTDSMAIHGGEVFFDAVGQEGDDGDSLNDQDHATSIYRAMISAALKETP